MSKDSSSTDAKFQQKPSLEQNGEGQRAPRELNYLSIAKDPSTSEILSALNGTGAHPIPMEIADDVRQLVVASTEDWSAKHGEMRIFERGAKNEIWHPIDFKVQINVGEKGMGWGAGGLITKPELNIAGRLERVGGPLFPQGKFEPSKDASGNVKLEGDKKTTAGVFRLGLAWATMDAPLWGDNHAPEGTSIPYKRIDADYRIVPSTASPIVDEQGRKVNGRIIREIDPQHGTYEQYEHGNFVKGSLSHSAMLKLNATTSNWQTHYRWVHKDLKDEQGRSLSEMLVQLHPGDAKSNNSPFRNPEAPSFLRAADGGELSFNRASYDGVNPDTGEKFQGSVDKKASKAIFNDSDYRWGDDSDIGHKLIVEPSGKAQVSGQANDDMKNHPVRLVNSKLGLYEHLDPADGKVISRGWAPPEVIKNLSNEDEDMNDAFYRNVLNILQNTGQQRGAGGDVFIHQESYLRRKEAFTRANGEKPDDTAGCISMSMANLRKFIATLKASSHPTILIAPKFELSTVREALDNK